MWARNNFAPGTAARAFNLSRTPGREPSDATEDRGVDIVVAYLRLRGKGRSYTAAVGDAAKQNFRGEKLVENLVAGLHTKNRELTDVQHVAIHSLLREEYAAGRDSKSLQHALGGEGWAKWLLHAERFRLKGPIKKARLNEERLKEWLADTKRDKSPNAEGFRLKGLIKKARLNEEWLKGWLADTKRDKSPSE
jgi:hypothetical protein